MFPAAESISTELLGYVKFFYQISRKEIEVGRHKTAGYTRHAIPSYILASASIEAVINEVLVVFAPIPNENDGIRKKESLLISPIRKK
jgi:hypothetical protein